MGTIARHPQPQQPWITSDKVRRYTLGLLLIIAVIMAFALTLNEAARRPTLGISVTQDAHSGAWIVDGVAYSSDAARAEATVGDIVRRIDDKDLVPNDSSAPSAVRHATQLTLQRSATGDLVTIGVLGTSPGSLSLLPYLFIGIIFVVVGAGALLLGRGETARALALLCCIGALEAIILPLVLFQEVAWVLVLNALIVPLFMGSFAYLFLVFPTERSLRLGHWRLQPAWILAFALPAMLSKAGAQLNTDLTPLLLGISQLAGFPYF